MGGIGGFKDLSELHIAAVDSGQPEMFETVLKAAMFEARHLFHSSTPTPSESGSNKSFPIYRVRDIRKMREEEGNEEWLCPLFMKAGEITLFGGESKTSGKTTFYAHMLKRVHDGKPFMGMPTTKSSALILTEQGSNILEATDKAGIEDDDEIYYAFYKDLAKEEWQDMLLGAVLHCENLNIRILVVDTLTSFAKIKGSEENISGEVIARMEPVLEVARVHGIHVSILHHTGKDGVIRGSSAWSKDPDVIWTLKRPPGDHAPNVRSLEGLGRYDDVNTYFNIALDSEDGGYKLLGSNSQIERAKALKSLLEKIPLGEEGAVRKTILVDQVHAETNVSKTTINRALGDAIKRGVVDEKRLAEKGSPVVLWKRLKRSAKHSDDSFEPDSQGTGEDESNKCADPAPVVEDSARLQEIIELIGPITTVALDLETMPPGKEWRNEILEAYRVWRGGRKTKPKLEDKKKRMANIKEDVYSKYALDTDRAEPRLISLAGGADELNVLVDVSKVDPTPLLGALKDKTLVTHNGTYDLQVLRRRYGYIHEGRVHDTQLLSALYHYAQGGERTKFDGNKKRLPDPRDTKVDLYGTGKKDTGMSTLAYVAHRHLARLLDKGAQKSDWLRPRLSEEQLAYALEDTRVLTRLHEVLLGKLYDLDMDAIVDLEARTFPAMVDMSINGFPADVDVAREMSERYGKEANTALAKLEELTPKDGWNFNSDDQKREILNLLGVEFPSKYPKTAQKKEPSMAGAALKTLKKPRAAVRWVEAYLEYESLRKLSGDFVTKYASIVRPDGTIKGSFDTISTGRFSCRRPNLQQVPKRGKLQKTEGMRIRDVFRPLAGDVFVIADFAQLELLLAATIAARETSREGRMLEVFQKAEVDIHRATAASLLGKEPAAVTEAERALAKAVNFGLLYGQKAEGLKTYAKNNYGVDMTLGEARAYRRAFFERYPEIAEWHRLVEAQCDRYEEYASTPLGRIRKLPVWTNSGKPASTTAKNHPVQGAGADAIKLTMARLFEDRGSCPGNPRLNVNVHDEVVVSVEVEHAEGAVEWVRSHMAAAEREAVVDPESPIIIDVEAKESFA
jgi:DNA polymerase I